MSNILEDLLKETKRAKALAEEQTKNMLEKVMGESVQNIIKESVKTNSVSTKSTVLTVNEEIGDDTTMDNIETNNIIVGDDSTMSDDTLNTPEVELTNITPDDSDIDLSDLSIEDMLDKLKDLLDNGEINDETEIVIKANPKTFDIDMNGGSIDSNDNEKQDDGDVDIDLDGEEDEDDFDKTFESYEFDTKIDESEKISNLNKIIENCEKDLKLFKNTNKQIVSENINLQKNVDVLNESLNQYKQVMTETKQVVSDLILNNTNLLHITTLFTEGVFTAKDKATVVENFEKVKTIGESKVLFEALKSKVVQDTKKNTIETKVVVKETIEQDLIKEEKTYSDPIFDMMKKISKKR